MNFAAFVLHNTAALQKQFCFKPPPSNKIAFACKSIVYTQSHEEKIKSLEAQLVALQANPEHVVDDISSSYKYEIVDVLINNPNSDNNKGLPEIRFYISKNKHN